MAQWTHKQYDLLERAITNGKRISAYRRGTEYIVVPTRLRVISGREAVEATQPGNRPANATQPNAGQHMFGNTRGLDAVLRRKVL